jgi:hypothetical protein
MSSGERFDTRPFRPFDGHLRIPESAHCCPAPANDQVGVGIGLSAAKPEDSDADVGARAIRHTQGSRWSGLGGVLPSAILIEGFRLSLRGVQIILRKASLQLKPIDAFAGHRW